MIFKVPSSSLTFFDSMIISFKTWFSMLKPVWYKAHQYKGTNGKDDVTLGISGHHTSLQAGTLVTGCGTNWFCIMTSTIYFDQSIKHRKAQKCNIPARASHPIHCCHPPGWFRAGGGQGCGPGRCALCGAGPRAPRCRNKSPRWQGADQQGRTSPCICKQEQSLCHYLQRGFHRAGSLLKLHK